MPLASLFLRDVISAGLQKSFKQTDLKAFLGTLIWVYSETIIIRVVGDWLLDIPIYQIDAFAERPFEGNPAAVCPLVEWLDDTLMQQIAAENNLAETAFVVREPTGYRIRWFTPECEIDLCGHATLAAAYVLWHCRGETAPVLTFASLSGPLKVTREGAWLQLDFPSRPAQAAVSDPQLLKALGAGAPLWFGRQGSWALVHLEDAAAVQALQPDFRAMKACRDHVVCVTAAGTGEADFICRLFAPAKGIDEDPVTGSAYTTLTPYWSERLGNRPLLARQVSARGGWVRTELAGERVLISGLAVAVLQGTFLLDGVFTEVTGPNGQGSKR